MFDVSGWIWAALNTAVVFGVSAFALLHAFTGGAFGDAPLSRELSVAAVAAAIGAGLVGLIWAVRYLLT